MEISINVTALACSGTFYGIWASIHFSLFEAVGDLSRIRRRTIYSLAYQSEGTEFVQFLDRLQQQSRYLLVEPRRVDPFLRWSLIGFLLISIVTIGYPTWKSLLPSFPDQPPFLYIYAGFLALATYFLCSETFYFRAFRRLEREFPPEVIQEGTKILIEVGHNGI